MFKNLFCGLLISFFVASFLITETKAKDLEELSKISDPGESIGNFDKSIVVKKVEIIGNQLIPDEIILKKIKTRKGSDFNRRKITYDLRSLNNLGYFDREKLIAVPVQYEDGVILRIQVVENRPITGILIEGNTSIKKGILEEYLEPLIGMPRSTVQIKNAIEKIEALYHDNGLLLASVTELHFNPDGYLRIKMDEGIIGSIEFLGNERTKENYLRKRIQPFLSTGEPYNEEKVSKLLQDLQSSGFFKEVTRELSPYKKDPSKHTVSFKVEEQRTKSLNFGTGIGNISGFFGDVSFTEPNFRGKGENLSVSAFAGTGIATAVDGDDGGRFETNGDFRLSTGYQSPYLFDTDASGGIGSSLGQAGSFLVDSSIRRYQSLGVNYSQNLGRILGKRKAGEKIKEKDLTWIDKSNLRLNLDISNTKMIGIGDGAKNQLIRSLKEDEKMTSEQAIAEAKKIRNKQTEDGVYLDFKPNLTYRSFSENGSGWKNSFFAGPSFGFGDGGSYADLGAEIRRYERLTDDGWYFKNSGRFQSLLGNPSDFRKLKTRGPYGMRGYRQFRDVGVGTSSLSNTMEMVFPLTIINDKLSSNKKRNTPVKNINLMVFNDTGVVFGEKRLNDLYDRESFLSGVGIGVEATIPMLGRLRLDYGIPIIGNSKSLFSGRFHVNTGSRF